LKVLIVKLSALGDVVQSLPVAMAIHTQMPDAMVDWLVEKPSASLLMGHPALNRVLVSPRHEITQGDGNIFTALTGFGRELRSVTYNAVLDLQGLMKSAMLVALCKAERKIGFKGGKEPLAAWPLTERLDPYDPDRHALERYLDFLEPLGLMRPAHPQFGLEPGAEALARVEELTGPGAGDGGGGPLVVLHPVAKWESKLWPMSHWAKLSRDLDGLGARLVLSGSGDDRGVTRAIASAAGVEIMDLAGRMSLKDLAALLSRADLLVSTDTGVMHLGAAMGCPVVALFGPTAHWRTGPYGQGHRVVRLDMDCAPCFKRECENPRCLGDLGPEMVLAQVKEALAPRS
jgi:heptosyltransferase-1